MFGFDFSELVVVFVVALIVLGPTRLPIVARKVGRWIGKARAMASDFRQQLENEVTLEELNRMTRETTKQNQAANAANATAQADAQATTPTAESLASGGYPYGAPAEAVPATPPADATSAAPQPGDDTYSHAHAAGATPEPWSPDPAVADARPVTDAAPATDIPLTPDPGAPGADRQNT